MNAVMMMSTLAMSPAHAARPKLEARVLHVDSAREAGLPARLELLPAQGALLVEGYVVVGREGPVDRYLYAVLEQAEVDETLLKRARRRTAVGRTLTVGGLAVELLGAGVMVATAPQTAPLALTLGGQLTLGGAGVALGGIGLWAYNPRLLDAVDQYNAWAEAHPEAVGLGLAEQRATPAP